MCDAQDADLHPEVKVVLSVTREQSGKVDRCDVRAAIRVNELPDRLLVAQVTKLDRHLGAEENGDDEKVRMRR